VLKFQALFGVFDGHGGSEAAEFCLKNIGQFIIDELEKREGQSSEAIEVVRKGYLRTDDEFLKGDTRGGACCLTALLHKGDLVISNAGDCRAVLCRGGQAEALSFDHKLSRQDERERVEQLVSPLLVILYIFICMCFSFV
jgi:protein phosphatase 1L